MIFQFWSKMRFNVILPLYKLQFYGFDGKIRFSCFGENFFVFLLKNVIAGNFDITVLSGRLQEILILQFCQKN